jgi:hypothetical protein
LGILAAGRAPSASVEAALQATATPVSDAGEPAPQDSAPQAGDADTELALLPEDTRPDSNCIDCHSNAEQLQLLAEEEEVQESLNEGSG